MVKGILSNSSVVFHNNNNNNNNFIYIYIYIVQFMHKMKHKVCHIKAFITFMIKQQKENIQKQQFKNKKDKNNHQVNPTEKSSI